MKTSEMKDKLLSYCLPTKCEDCVLPQAGYCNGSRYRWASGTSKDTRKAFHIVFPDYIETHNKSQKNESIIIWVEGNEVYAKRLSTGESGVARCSPKDEFNLLTGINLAVARMLGADKPSCSKCEYHGVSIISMPCISCCRACWTDNFKEKQHE